MYLLNIVKTWKPEKLWQHTITVSNGVPQGLVLGPHLWNMIYDGVLRLSTPSGVSITGFADDITVVAEVQTKNDFELTVKKTVSRIHDWRDEGGLRIVPE